MSRLPDKRERAQPDTASVPESIWQLTQRTLGQVETLRAIGVTSSVVTRQTWEGFVHAM